MLNSEPHAHSAKREAHGMGTCGRPALPSGVCAARPGPLGLPGAKELDEEPEQHETYAELKSPTGEVSNNLSFVQSGETKTH